VHQFILVITNEKWNWGMALTSITRYSVHANWPSQSARRSWCQDPEVPWKSVKTGKQIYYALDFTMSQARGHCLMLTRWVLKIIMALNCFQNYAREYIQNSETEQSAQGYLWNPRTLLIQCTVANKSKLVKATWLREWKGSTI